MESLPSECRSRPTRPGRAEGQTSASRSGSPARTPGAVNTSRYSQSCQPPFVSGRQELRASFPFRACRASNQTRTAQLCNSCPSKAARRSLVCVLRACGFEPDTPAALMSPALVSQSANLSSPAVTLEEAAHRRRTPTSQRRQRKAQNRSRSLTGPLVWRLGTSPQHHWNHKVAHTGKGSRSPAICSLGELLWLQLWRKSAPICRPFQTKCKLSSPDEELLLLGVPSSSEGANTF